MLGNPLGYYIGVNFKREFRSYNDGTSASYFLGETNAPGLTKYYDLNDARSVESPQLGGMINLAYKLNNNNQLEFTTLYNHDTEISSRYQNGAWPGGISNSDATFETRNLGFRERTLLSYQLAGEHLLNPAKEIKLEWGASIFNTSQEDPDLRFLQIQMSVILYIILLQANMMNHFIFGEHWKTNNIRESLIYLFLLRKHLVKAIN